MKQHPLRPLIVKAITEMEDELQLYGFDDNLFDNSILMEEFLKTFSFDNKNECLWCWDIIEYIDSAVEHGYVTELEREDFLLEYLLGVSS